jgi:uncharacterized protein
MLPSISRGQVSIADELFPETSRSSQGFWDGLEVGELRVQRCMKCHRSRIPSAPLCPYCLYDQAEWHPADGQATVFSWIRYHKAYLPTYTDVPYTVITAELTEGVRMYGRLLDKTGQHSTRRPDIGERVHAVVEEWANGRRTIAFQEGA